MRFVATPLNDAWIVELEPVEDSRGFFARSFSSREFESRGLNPVVAQCNISMNHKKGTLRGMHYQVPPAAETKFVRCTAGAIYDVIIDLRPDSSTYLRHFGVELSAENHRSLYLPRMFAHGYMTLTDNAVFTYQVSEFYAPGFERGIRYDDPAFGIEWPLEVAVISDKDASWPPFDAREHRE
ncbi:MAG TPA: dTDP-4-dehydrorhamnose 3,5-epimerase [Gammaproteobacteria bacterium]|nr:dTDP-4-dehydrorhamnose 3,5-epimerase [Gammaproteobacteria bacterium]